MLRVLIKWFPYLLRLYHIPGIFRKQQKVTLYLPSAAKLTSTLENDNTQFPSQLIRSSPVLNSVRGTFCIESLGVSVKPQNIGNVRYNRCNFTIVFSTSWRKHAGSTLVRPYSFRTKPKQIIIMCTSEVDDNCKFDPWHKYPYYDYELFHMI